VDAICGRRRTPPPCRGGSHGAFFRPRGGGGGAGSSAYDFGLSASLPLSATGVCAFLGRARFFRAAFARSVPAGGQPAHVPSLAATASIAPPVASVSTFHTNVIMTHSIEVLVAHVYLHAHVSDRARERWERRAEVH
jgi:hypothetical protein